MKCFISSRITIYPKAMRTFVPKKEIKKSSPENCSRDWTDSKFYL